MKVAIVKYNAGNTQSVIYALNRLGIDPLLTSDEAELRAADKVIFPGVGEASTAMRFLKERNLDKVVKELKQPVLGVCLGMQLLCKHSEENNTECLGIVPVDVKRFPAEGLKIPQIGWNVLTDFKGPVFNDIKDKSYVYFVHSYYVPVGDYTIATSEYGLKYTAALQYKNFYAMQFHPEKSSEVGEKLIKNFLDMK